jgi:hypothetical protein
VVVDVRERRVVTVEASVRIEEGYLQHLPGIGLIVSILRVATPFTWTRRPMPARCKRHALVADIEVDAGDGAEL